MAQFIVLTECANLAFMCTCVKDARVSDADRGRTIKKMLNVDVGRGFRKDCAVFPGPFAVRQGVFIFMVKWKLFVTLRLS